MSDGARPMQWRTLFFRRWVYTHSEAIGHGIGLESKRVNIRLNDPDFAIAIVVDQFAVVVLHVLGPHDLGAVDIRIVVDPFLMQAMRTGVVDDHEVLSGSVAQTVNDGRPKAERVERKFGDDTQNHDAARAVGKRDAA